VSGDIYRPAGSDYVGPDAREVITGKKEAENRGLADALSPPASCCLAAMTLSQRYSCILQQQQRACSPAVPGAQRKGETAGVEVPPKGASGRRARADAPPAAP